MDFYEVYALDRLSNRDTLIRIDRVFATFNEFWNYGDTLVKERGTTTVTLRKRDSIFGTDVFVTEWTCEHGLITNGEPHSVWVERVEKFRRRHPTGRWDFGKYNQEDCFSAKVMLMRQDLRGRETGVGLKRVTSGYGNKNKT
jgi:hypothetical protein